MDNIVSLGADRPRPQRMFDVPRSGARILFFTGVRYCRDDEPAPSCRVAPDCRDAVHGALSDRVLDATAH